MICADQMFLYCSCMPDAPKRSLARHMRRAPTSSEAKLWELLRGRRLEGLKFRRQAPVGRYVADFVCYRHRLIIEADGPFHDDDAERDAWLSSQGFRIVRFPERHDCWRQGRRPRRDPESD